MNLKEISAALEEEGIDNIVVAGGNTEEVDELLDYLSKVKEFTVAKEIKNLSEGDLSKLNRCFSTFEHTYWDCFEYLNTNKLYKDPYAEFATILHLHIVKYKKAGNSVYAILKNRYNSAAISAFTDFLKEYTMSGSNFENMCNSYAELSKQVENTLEEILDIFG